ncbi:MAG: helix-turn-helix transcriptional regulator [Phycisphaeraceae bacterium]|nr:helix-turn-helix transcriptional regulator [Phycisphaeraceae bacterium]
MTQQELADLVGVRRQTINAIETAKCFPSLEVACRIARLLGTNLEAVFEAEFKRSAPICGRACGRTIRPHAAAGRKDRTDHRRRQRYRAGVRGGVCAGRCAGDRDGHR